MALREKASLAGMLSYAALLLFLSSTPAGPAEKVKVGTALKFQAVFAMPMLAIEENGFWKQQGLEAEWVPFDMGAVMTRAMAARAIQIGVNDITGFLVGAGRGVPSVIFWHLGMPIDFAVWVKAASSIWEAAELKGRTMDVGRLGDAAHAYGQLLAKAKGLEKQIRFVGTGGLREMVAALKTGATDSAILTTFAAADLLVAGEIRPIMEVVENLPKEWMGRVVESHREFVRRDSEAVGKVAKAILQGTDFVMKNRAWTLEKLQSYSRYSQKAAEFLYPILTYSKDGRINTKALTNVRQFLIDYGIVAAEKTPRAEELYTDRFTR